MYRQTKIQVVFISNNSHFILRSKHIAQINNVHEVRWIGCLTSQLTIFLSYMWQHIDVQAEWRSSYFWDGQTNMRLTAELVAIVLCYMGNNTYSLLGVTFVYRTCFLGLPKIFCSPWNFVSKQLKLDSTNFLQDKENLSRWWARGEDRENPEGWTA